MPPARLVDPPDWFSEGQRQLWTDTLACAPIGMLRRIDGSALSAWVVAADLHRQACVLQGRYPLLVLTPVTNVPMQSPYLAIINKQSFIMAKWAAELGFTPVSRPRINAGASPAPTAPVDAPPPGTTRHVPLAEYLASAPSRERLN